MMQGRVVSQESQQKIQGKEKERNPGGYKRGGGAMLGHSMGTFSRSWSWAKKGSDPKRCKPK